MDVPQNKQMKKKTPKFNPVPLYVQKFFSVRDQTEEF